MAEFQSTITSFLPVIDGPSISQLQFQKFFNPALKQNMPKNIQEALALKSAQVENYIEYANATRPLGFTGEETKRYPMQKYGNRSTLTFLYALSTTSLKCPRCGIGWMG